MTAADTIEVHANIVMTTESLRVIVDNTKKMAGRNEKGHYTVDTADAVSVMVSRFLLEKNFESYAKDEKNYPPCESCPSG